MKMSIQKENVIPFVVTSKDELVPLEAEFAYIIGVVGDKIKKGGFFKRSKERLTQVSKLYWRLIVDTIHNRILLVDTLGIYGGGADVQDLSLSNIFAQLKAIQDASTVMAYTENLEETNQVLILASDNYPLFDEKFTRSTFELVKQSISEDMIDTPLVLPSFEDSISSELIQLLNETPRFDEAEDILRELAQQWLAEINEEITTIERDYAGRIARKQSEVETRLEQFKEKLDQVIDSNLEKANQAIFSELSTFESSTLGLTGMINPIQEHARQILNDVPSVETPKFQESMKSFLSKSKGQVDNISTKVKEMEDDCKNLEKNLNGITKQFLDAKQKAMDDYEQKKAQAEREVDELRMTRDRALSNLTGMRESIKQNTESICQKLQKVKQNRKDAINKSTISGGADIPTDIIISLYLIKFQDKNDIRYFVIPPLIKPRGRRNVDYPNAEMDSAIISGKKAADKLAEELVFNRRLKTSFDALRATNYLATGEFIGAVRQGLNYLVQNKMISKKAPKRILELMDNLDL
jgi:cytochrome c556